MAPAATPGRKRQARENRENQYFNPGVQGRKTGITLKRNSLDEDGFEKLDGLFSSPEKSPQKRAAGNVDATLTSESMQMAKSSIPEPTEVLSTRRLLKSTKTTFPPPAGRTPLRTNIGSSPRRQSSVAPRAAANRGSTPNRANSQPAVNRRLDFSADVPQQSVENSPKRRIGARRAPPTRSDVYDLPPTESPPLTNGFHEEYGHGEVIYENEPLQFEDASLPALVEEPLADLNEDQSESEPAVVAPVKAIKGKGKARTRISDATKEKKLSDAPVLQPASKTRSRGGRAATRSKDVPDEPVEEPEPEMPPPSSKRRGRPRKSNSIAPDTSSAGLVDSEFPEIEETMISTSSSKKRGRPKKLAIHQDHEEEEEEEEPVKPPPKRQKKGGRAPKEVDPNIRMPPPIPAKQRANRSPSRMSTTSYRSNARRPRTLTILNELADPSQDEGMCRTRSGRTVVRPLEFWRGEKVERDLDGGMAGIVRATEEELPAPKRPASVRPGGGRRRAAYTRAREMSVLEEDEDEGGEMGEEPWEQRGDVLSAPMYQWDNERQEAMEEQIQQEMAVSSRSIQPRQVQGGHFEYTKFMSTAFFGCGRLDLKPGGFKTKKNTRKMHQMFFVHEGKVVVAVNNAEFVISKGGVWYVPRGNFYSIRNDFDRSAKLIFAQGCELQSSLDVYD